ncbi:head-tail connector protein [Aeromonas veronii]|uniref:head-tail connector protein n=1 Tax=Aeromonas veronii TaxID=654 RepID=UPI0038D425A6|nr:head-tail connector protein [Aeromonas veronii]
MTTIGLSYSLVKISTKCAPALASHHIGEPVVNDSTMKPSIKAGCLLLIGTLYEARADTTELQRHAVPQTVERLWSAHRIHGVY